MYFEDEVSISNFSKINSLLNTNVMILGVSGWGGNKVGLKALHVRIAFVVSVLLFGFGVGLYLILWIVKFFVK